MQDQKEAMMEIMIISCKQNDEIFFEHGFEEDDFLATVIQYNLLDDPEVREMYERSLQALAKEGMMGR